MYGIIGIRYMVCVPVYAIVQLKCDVLYYERTTFKRTGRFEMFQFVVSHDSNVQHMKHVQLELCNCTCFKFCQLHAFVSHKSKNQTKDIIFHVNQTYRCVLIGTRINCEIGTVTCKYVNVLL